MTAERVIGHGERRLAGDGNSCAQRFAYPADRGRRRAGELQSAGDGAAATADCLAGVVAAVGAGAEVYVDGGVRTGRHALAALALGARAVFLGRLPLYALAAGGTAGVARLLDELSIELDEALRLVGSPTVAGLTPDLLAPTIDIR